MKKNLTINLNIKKKSIENQTGKKIHAEGQLKEITENTAQRNREKQMREKKLMDFENKFQRLSIYLFEREDRGKKYNGKGQILSI